jgi:hypothetical protein
MRWMWLSTVAAALLRGCQAESSSAQWAGVIVGASSIGLTLFLESRRGKQAAKSKVETDARFLEQERRVQEALTHAAIAASALETAQKYAAENKFREEGVMLARALAHSYREQMIAGLQDLNDEWCVFYHITDQVRVWALISMVDKGLVEISVHSRIQIGHREPIYFPVDMEALVARAWQNHNHLKAAHPNHGCGGNLMQGLMALLPGYQPVRISAALKELGYGVNPERFESRVAEKALLLGHVRFLDVWPT